MLVRPKPSQGSPAPFAVPRGMFDSGHLSSSLSGVSLQQRESWAARSWDPAFSFKQERARFQQKQLQEKEEKLLKLYEEQQERAMHRVGSRVQSGGSSVSSTSSVGRGKVRHMFQSRRGNSESRQGRDRSYPLEPLKPPSLPIRAQSLDVESSQQRERRVTGSWSNASALRTRAGLNRHNSDLQLRPAGGFYGESDELDEEEEEEFRRRGGGVRRTQSQVRAIKPKSKLLYFGGSHTDLRFSDESDYVQTFQVIDDHYEIPDRDLIKKKDRHPEVSYPYNKEDEYFINNFNNKRQFYESRLRSDSDLLSRNAELFEKLPNVGMNRSNSVSQRKESADGKAGRYKTFVTQKPFAEKPHLGNEVAAARRGEGSGGREAVAVSPPPRHSNGNPAISPVMKVRKATPMPGSVAPKQHLLQTRRTNVPVRQSPTREVTPPIPASRTTVSRAPPGLPQSEKPPIGKKTTRGGAPPRSNPQSDLPSCQFCGRHFAEDRVAKHQEICRKSSKSKRKPFDSVKQRVKGTEAEQFLKGGKLRGQQQQQQQQQKQMKVPQKDWRKTHEDFINSIRAAREYQVSTNQSRKPSNPRPPTAPRY